MKNCGGKLPSREKKKKRLEMNTGKRWHLVTRKIVIQRNGPGTVTWRVLWRARGEPLQRKDSKLNDGVSSSGEKSAPKKKSL